MELLQFFRVSVGDINYYYAELLLKTGMLSQFWIACFNISDVLTPDIYDLDLTS